MAQSVHGTSAPALPATPDLAELASDFPDYEFIELIGRGGMGAVYQAMQRNLQRTVAIKVLPKELASDPEFGERFLREAQTLATLNHPGIITVYDYGERNGVFFLVTEFVDGVNLRQLMELGELSPAEALRIAPQLCTALQFAHERGVVHRDIKPENILIDTNGQVKVADFGLAKVARPGDAVELTRNTAVLGTPHYMAPEQWNGARQVDHRADIYSLGVVIYEMLTGNLPLGNFDMPSERSGVPQGLDAVVRRALAQQPKNRYQHARDVQSDVERQAQQLDTQQANHEQANRQQAGHQQQPGIQQGTAPNTAPATPTHSQATMVKGPIIALAGLVLAILTIGYLAFTEKKEYSRAYRYKRDLQSYHEATEQAIAQAQNSQEITSIVSMPVAPADPTIAIETVKVMSAGLAGGMLLLLIGLGFSSIRTIRNSYGRKTGLGSAVITAWVVPLGTAGGLIYAPLGAIRNNDLKVILGFVVVSAMIYGTVRFLIWEHARQRRLIDAGVLAVRGRSLTAAAMALGLTTIGVAIAASNYRHPKLNNAFKHAGATFANDLIGCSRPQVIEHLGPPLAITWDTAGEQWSYRNEHDQPITTAITFHERRNQVTSVAVNSLVFQANPYDPTIPQLGASIATFIQAYGPPTEHLSLGWATRYRFSNGTRVTTHEDMVLAVFPTKSQDNQTMTTTTVHFIESKSLLGKTRAEVLEQLGPPLGINFSANSEEWCYLSEQKQRVEQAVVFAGDHVASTDNEHLTLQSNPADMSKPQLGQSMNEFVKLYGAPASRTEGQLASTFTFDNGVTVTVRDGVVTGVVFGAEDK